MIWMLFILFYFIISFSFSFFIFLLLLDHNKPLLPRRLSRLLRDGSDFDLCVLVSLVYEDVLDHTILMEKKRGIWRNGVLYITIFYGETIRKFGGATHMRAGQAGNGEKKWRKYHTHFTPPPPGEKIVSKDDYNYTTGVLVGLIGLSFCCYLFFFLFPSLTPYPSSLASPATCTERNWLIEYWADAAALYWAFVLQWEGMHISIYMHV